MTEAETAQEEESDSEVETVTEAEPAQEEESDSEVEANK